MSHLPPEEARRRTSALQTRMGERNPPLDALLLAQNVDVYYVSGTFQTAHLIVPREGEPRLLVRKVLERAREDSPLADVRPLRSLRDLAAELRSLCGAGRLRVGLELDVVPARLLASYRELLGEGIEIEDASDLVLGVRAIKSEWEIERIREASLPIARLLHDLPEILGGELSTYELQAILDCRARTAGHPGVIRMRGFNVECSLGIVVSGPSGAAPSHSFFPVGGRGVDPAWPAGGDDEPIERDTPILLDYLGAAQGYYADQTRMAVLGRFPRRAGEIYGAMTDILRHCERTIRAGSIPSRIYCEALELARSRGLEEGFMGPPGMAVGFLGHSIGLEVNESPVLAPRFDRPLPAGSVLAIEPKFIHPELGVIGIENTYVVREDRLENLTPIPEMVQQV